MDATPGAVFVTVLTARPHYPRYRVTPEAFEDFEEEWSGANEDNKNFFANFGPTDNEIEFINSNPDTITRLTGSFITDGFVDGQGIDVRFSVSNDGLYTIATVAALTLTLIGGDALLNESPSVAAVQIAVLSRALYDAGALIVEAFEGTWTNMVSYP